MNFAYEGELESQVSGKKLQIPVWMINDYQREIRVNAHCEVLDLQGHNLWSKDFGGTIGGDESKEMGVVEWVTPGTPGVYVLRGQASEVGGKLQTENSTFIKVTPKLFPRPMNVLVIGERKYAYPIAEMLQAMGLNVEVFEENDFHKLARLRDSEEIRKNFDVAWLASFDSLWKLLSKEEAEGLKRAISEGVAFIHSGGPGSYHGGFGRGACLEFTPLAEVLPVKLQRVNDLIYGQAASPRSREPRKPARVMDIEAGPQAEAGWSETGLRDYGLEGFNRVELKEGAKEILTASGHPLLVTGQYGQGRTVAFTGFTPDYRGRHADWDPEVVYPYMLDQEFYNDPATKAYFDVFARMIAMVTGENATRHSKDILAEREKPLFEMLKEQPAVDVKVPASLQAKVSGKQTSVSLDLTNGAGYARLVRVRAEWNGPQEEAPYLVMYSDNYFDLLPGQAKTVTLDVYLPKTSTGTTSGTLIVEGSNVSAKQIPITLQAE